MNTNKNMVDAELALKSDLQHFQKTVLIPFFHIDNTIQCGINGYGECYSRIIGSPNPFHTGGDFVGKSKEQLNEYFDNAYSEMITASNKSGTKMIGIGIGAYGFCIVRTENELKRFHLMDMAIEYYMKLKNS